MQRIAYLLFCNSLGIVEALLFLSALSAHFFLRFYNILLEIYIYFYQYFSLSQQRSATSFLRALFLADIICVLLSFGLYTKLKKNYTSSKFSAFIFLTAARL